MRSARSARASSTMARRSLASMPAAEKRPSSRLATAAWARAGSRSARTMRSKKPRRRAMAATAAPTPPAPRTRGRMRRGSLSGGLAVEGGAAWLRRLGAHGNGEARGSAAPAEEDLAVPAPAGRLRASSALERGGRGQQSAGPALRGLAEPGRLVDRVADHGVLEPGHRSDVARDGRARRDADRRLQPAVEGPQAPVQLARRRERAAGMVGIGHRRAEHAQRRVALELVDEA